MEQALTAAGCDASSRRAGGGFGLGVAQGFTADYMHCLRISLLSPTDLAEMSLSDPECGVDGTCLPHNSTGMLSLDNERVVVRTLPTHMHALITQCESTIEEDPNLLKGELAGNMRMVVELRRREKVRDIIR